MTSKHTPGPWEAFANGNTRIGAVTHIHGPQHYRSGYCVAFVQNHGDRHDADARLIAAAPEMLAALKDALRMLPAFPPHDPNRYRFDAIRDAVAKAEGR